MKKKLTALIALFCALFVITAIAGNQGTKVGTIEKDRFISPDMCGGCHMDIYRMWKGSMHATAFRDPLFQSVAKLFLAEVKTDEEKIEAELCIKCHTPIGYFTGEIVKTSDDFAKASEVAAKGISCDFCHSITQVHGGNANLTITPGHGEDDPGIKHGPFTDAENDFHDSEYSKPHTKSKFCGTCHEVWHVAFKTPLESTYSEWKAGPYNTGDPQTTVHCQDCHMRQKPGVPATGSTKRPDNPGKAAAGAKERPHIFTHYFVGANAVPELVKSKAHRQMAVERLKNAARVSLITKGDWQAGSKASVEVKVENIGAGHKLPTGLTEVRQCWLRVAVTDASGKVVFQSGRLDEAGKIADGAVIYNTVLGDKEGKPTINVAQATQVLKDYRIKPKESVTEKYELAIPADAQGPFTVTAELLYRSAPQKIVNIALGDSAPKIPVIEMASASMEVNK